MRNSQNSIGNYLGSYSTEKKRVEEMDAMQRQLWSKAKAVPVEVQFKHVTMIVLSQEAEIARENGSCSAVSGCLCHALDGRPVLHAMLFMYLAVFTIRHEHISTHILTCLALHKYDDRQGAGLDDHCAIPSEPHLRNMSGLFNQ